MAYFDALAALKQLAQISSVPHQLRRGGCDLLAAQPMCNVG
jgi:hypothetical protein